MALHLEDERHLPSGPSPMSTTPAFSPGPQITCGPVVGRVRSHFFELLYEQCSFHIAEKMPSSVSVGTRPIRSRMRWYSSGFSPCAATSASVISGSRERTASGMGAPIGSGASLIRGLTAKRKSGKPSMPASGNAAREPGAAACISDIDAPTTGHGFAFARTIRGRRAGPRRRGSMAISVNEASAVLRAAVRDTIRQRALLFLAQSAVMVAAGVLALIFPAFASAGILALLGWLLVISGVVQVISLWGATQVPYFWLQLVTLALEILVGYLLITRPEAGLVAVTFLMLVLFLISGIARVVFALMIRPMQDWLWVLLSGFVAIALRRHPLRRTCPRPRPGSSASCSASSSSPSAPPRVSSPGGSPGGLTRPRIDRGCPAVGTSRRRAPASAKRPNQGETMRKLACGLLLVARRLRRPRRRSLRGRDRPRRAARAPTFPSPAARPGSSSAPSPPPRRPRRSPGPSCRAESRYFTASFASPAVVLFPDYGSQAPTVSVTCRAGRALGHRRLGARSGLVPRRRRLAGRRHLGRHRLEQRRRGRHRLVRRRGRRFDRRARRPLSRRPRPASIGRSRPTGRRYPRAGVEARDLLRTQRP